MADERCDNCKELFSSQWECGYCKDKKPYSEAAQVQTEFERLHTTLKNIEVMLESCHWDDVLCGMVSRAVEAALKGEKPCSLPEEK